MQRYEIATLTTTLGAAAKAAPAIIDFTGSPEAKGRLLGLWATDIGPLNQVIVLRGFDEIEDLSAERERTLRSSNPFGAAPWLVDLSLDSYAPFPFMPPVEAGAFGPVYEIRTYVLKHGGVAPTIAAWEAAMPRRSDYSPLLAAFHSLDGPPRITHIWPYADLAQRAQARSQSVVEGAWPPKGGPDWLTSDMQSAIALPLAESPLR